MTINFTPAQLLGQTQSHLTQLDDGKLVHHHIKSDWLALVEAAKSDGIDIAIVSAYRSFDQQLAIWNAKARGQRVLNDRNNVPLVFEQLNSQQLVDAILNWSALAGASRHHWGTDIDIYSPSMINRSDLKLEPWEYQPQGPMAALGDWLTHYLPNSAFFLPYQQDLGGVAVEPWHLSHAQCADVAQRQLSLPLLKQCICDSKIELKEQILATIEHIYHQYVINISPSS